MAWRRGDDVLSTSKRRRLCSALLSSVATALLHGRGGSIDGVTALSSNNS